MPDERPSAEQVRVALAEVLAWQGLSRSPQLAELLRYVVERTLSGDEASIKAYSIAVDVFGRPASFDPQADPIVRVQARRLRTLLEQYYESGMGQAEVEIRLPLGRYVPEFPARGGATAEAAAPGAASGVPAGPSRRSLRRFLLDATIGLGFALLAVGLAVGLLRPEPSQPSGVPVKPTLRVAAFDNLTGDPALDAAVVQFDRRVAALLGAFDEIAVDAESVSYVGGTVQAVDGKLVVRASLMSNEQDTRWSQQLSGGDVRDAAAGLERIAVSLAAQLGNAAGPLHQPGRLWLEGAENPQPEPYVCDLMFMDWRDHRDVEHADRASGCFETLLSRGDDAHVLAALASIGSWKAQFVANSQTDMVGSLNVVAGQVARAVTLAPQSSFVYEQQAAVLARQGSVDAAMGAIERSRQLNPSNMDVVAALGTILWLTARWDDARAASEAAIAMIPSPPPWYYVTRALLAFRDQRYFDAIDAAQVYIATDDEVAVAIILGSAPRVGRLDLIERYKPVLLANRRFQAEGVMARLQVRLRVEGALVRLREGLILAGIPVNVLDRPFDADGSARDD